MAVGGLFRYAQRALFAPPTPERQLLRLVKGRSIRRVVELGLEDVAVTKRLLGALVKQAAGESVHYTLIDPFEQRPAGATELRLADVYRDLRPTEARLRLAPNSLSMGVASEANSLIDTDLLVLSRAASDDALGEAWFYVPRMCHPGTMVLRRQHVSPEERADAWTPLSTDEVAGRAARSRRLAA